MKIRLKHIVLKSLLCLTAIAFVGCDRYEPEPMTTIVLFDDNYQTNQNSALALDILTNDQIEGEVVIEVSNPSNGSISVADGSTVFRYTPRHNFIGTDMFEYSVCDLNGNCEFARILVNVIDPNPPCNTNLKAQADILHIEDPYKQNVKIFSIEELLANDAACPGQISVETFEIISYPIHGELVRDGDRFTYISEANYIGTDMLEYVVRSKSNRLVSSTAPVNIFVGVDPDIF